MIDINSWMNDFLNALNAEFGERVWFVGLQGSYARGEATETSDIDAVVIFDKFSAEDIMIYGSVLDRLPYRKLICGFVSGRDEILNWEASELFQFYSDTLPVKGSLDVLLERINADAVDRAIKTGVCSIYHGCVHNMLHEKSADILRSLYKSASFVVQAIYFKQSGCYVRNLAELSEKVMPAEREIVDNFSVMKKGEDVCFGKASEQLFNWAKHWIAEI